MWRCQRWQRKRKRGRERKEEAVSAFVVERALKRRRSPNLDVVICKKDEKMMKKKSKLNKKEEKAKREGRIAKNEKRFGRKSDLNVEQIERRVALWNRISQTHHGKTKVNEWVIFYSFFYYKLQPASAVTSLPLSSLLFQNPKIFSQVFDFNQTSSGFTSENIYIYNLCDYLIFLLKEEYMKNIGRWF